MNALLQPENSESNMSDVENVFEMFETATYSIGGRQRPSRNVEINNMLVRDQRASRRSRDGFSS